VAVMVAEPITFKQFHEAAGVDDWRVLWSVAVAVFCSGDFATDLKLVEQMTARGGGRSPSGSHLSSGVLGVRWSPRSTGPRLLGDGTSLDEDNDASPSRCRVDR
jgi:hypothetical protein